MTTHKEFSDVFCFPFLLFRLLEVTQTVGQAKRTAGKRGKIDHYQTKLYNYSGNKPKKVKESIVLCSFTLVSGLKHLV